MVSIFHYSDEISYMNFAHITIDLLVEYFVYPPFFRFFGWYLHPFWKAWTHRIPDVLSLCRSRLYPLLHFLHNTFRNEPVWWQWSMVRLLLFTPSHKFTLHNSHCEWFITFSYISSYVWFSVSMRPSFFHLLIVIDFLYLMWWGISITSLKSTLLFQKSNFRPSHWGHHSWSPGGGDDERNCSKAWASSALRRCTRVGG